MFWTEQWKKVIFHRSVMCATKTFSKALHMFASLSPEKRDEPLWVVGASPGALSAFPRKNKSCCFSQGHLGQPWLLHGRRPPQASWLALLGLAHSAGAPTP